MQSKVGFNISDQLGWRLITFIGHKHLYFNGVLHRDISPGNILINWCPGSDADKPSTSGRLIDLDHAKKGKQSPGQVTVQPDNDDVNEVLAFIRRRVETDVARQALQFFPVTEDNTTPTNAYITAARMHASKFRGLTKEEICTLQRLRWKRVCLNYYLFFCSDASDQVETLYDFDFNGDEYQKGSRTVRFFISKWNNIANMPQGTIPYTSGEIMSLQRYFRGHRPVFHDAVHDLESFFWVLIHICITRKGPGAGDHCQELEQANDENQAYHTLRRVILCFFESDDATIRENKRELFQNPHHVGEFVLDQFHPYFRPLRKLVEEWYHVLQLAHEFHAFEYRDIHDMVLEIVDKTLVSLPANGIDHAAQEVLNDRKADIEHCRGNPFGTKVQYLRPRHGTLPSSRRHVSYSSSPTPTPETRLFSRQVQENVLRAKWHKSGMLRPLLGWCRRL